MKDIVAVVLAAGKGTRMKSDRPKVLHKILGRPIIHYVLDAVRGAGVKDIVVVTGYGKDKVRSAVKGLAKVVVQKRLLGSGDAVRSARLALGRYSGDLLIVCGDTPLVSSDCLRSIIEKHKKSSASLTILTAHVEDPASYGRVVRGEGGRIAKITELLDADTAEERIHEVNVGTYVFRKADLFSALAEAKPNSKKGEIFLTDTVEILRRKGKIVEGVAIGDARTMIGINSRLDLACATEILKREALNRLMEEGVTIEDPGSTVIFPGVRIGRDSVIHSNTVIESDVEIGERCHIGPFARFRPGTRLGDGVEVGNFVELVRTTVGDRTRIKHHTYLGDTVIGKDVNVGAGTITANFDGVRKNRTVIKDGASIGIGARLVAPVRIGKNSVVGAGAVVTRNHDVPDGATVAGVPARILKNNR